MTRLCTARLNDDNGVGEGPPCGGHLADAQLYGKDPGYWCSKCKTWYDVSYEATAGPFPRDEIELAKPQIENTRRLDNSEVILRAVLSLMRPVFVQVEPIGTPSVSINLDTIAAIEEGHENRDFCIVRLTTGPPLTLEETRGAFMERVYVAQRQAVIHDD